MPYKQVFFILAFALLLGGCGVLPPATTIDVPFTSQAPAGNWSEPWQNACEETSIYMVSSFYAQDEIKRAAAIARIKEILAAKNKEINVSKDESLETIAKLINILGLPWTTQLIENPSIDDLKKELTQNHPIIVPVYAPTLADKHYWQGGPDYHVMVMTGYDDATGEFIVNDPAVQNGKGFRFKYDLFMSAIHDLDAKNYQAGKKAVLFTKEVPLDSWIQN